MQALGAALGISLPGEEWSRVPQVSVRKHHTGFQAAPGRAPAASFPCHWEAKCLQTSLTSRLHKECSTGAPRVPSQLGQPLCLTVGHLHRRWTRSAMAVRPVHTHTAGTRQSRLWEMESRDVTGTSPSLGPAGLPGLDGQDEHGGRVQGLKFGLQAGGPWQRCNGTVPRMGAQGATHSPTHSRLLLLLPGPSGLQMLPVAGAGSHATHGVPSLSCSSP